MFDALETGYNALFQLLERLYELPTTDKDAVVKYLHKMHELVYPEWEDEDTDDPVYAAWEDFPDLEERLSTALGPIVEEILRENNG